MRKHWTIDIAYLTILISVLIFSIVNSQMSTVRAQSSACSGGSSLPRAEGLVTTPSLSGIFNTSGACVTDSKVAFAPFKIPTYADLESLYYTQSKLTKNTMSSFPAGFSGDGIYITGADLSAGGTITGSGVEVIFVEGNLNINSNLIYHTNDGLGGLVFVVKGDLIIDASVTQIDAVLISEGKIYTAGADCAVSSVPSSALKINGSIISLNQTDSSPIRFCRSLSDNSKAAEVINTQPKYLVILRHLVSDTYQRWSEVP